MHVEEVEARQHVGAVHVFGGHDEHDCGSLTLQRQELDERTQVARSNCHVVAFCRQVLILLNKHDATLDERSACIHSSNKLAPRSSVAASAHGARGWIPSGLGVRYVRQLEGSHHQAHIAIERCCWKTLTVQLHKRQPLTRPGRYATHNARITERSENKAGRAKGSGVHFFLRVETCEVRCVGWMEVKRCTYS